MGSRKSLLVASVLVALTGGWMAFDGAHALVTGDFVTPRSGPYAGELGPWASLLAATGVNPRSTGVKIFFLAFGLTYLTAMAALMGGQRRARPVLLVCAALALLYLPFGTITSAAVLLLLFTNRSIQ